MSKIQITTSGSVAWKEHKRRRALTSVVKSFILEDVSKPNVVCVDSRHSVVVVAFNDDADVGVGRKDGPKSNGNVQISQSCLPSPALRLSHGCEPSASYLYYRRFVRRTNVGVDVERRSYELQDVSLWIQDESDDSELEGWQ